jgi:pimeloyl-ACP methyl ester carboxylesterase
MEGLMFWIACATLLSLIAGVFAALLAYRKLRQAKVASTLKIESAQGIVEERFVSIGGIDQWISIRGEDQSNPVLLVIHGGPGSCYTIFTPHLRGWEKHFTVVQWDQRGAGKTFARMDLRGHGGFSLGRLASDGISVAEYLRARLQKERLFLLASSMGSTFGLQIARSRPDMFYAYIGTDQNVGMVRARDEIHRQALDRLRMHGLTRGVRALERIGADPALWTRHDFTAVAQWTMKSDPPGFRRTIKLLKNAVWYAPGWKLRDIRAFVAGMRFSLEQLLPEIVQYDAWAQGTRFELPIFIFQGETDVLTTSSMARALFNDIVAPTKQMELISGAGHFAAFLQPELFLEKLLTYVRPLAYSSTKVVHTA